ncbi:MAG: hypothetical protein ACK2UN_11530 [Candidatus Promineifilaceae bacterium]
MRRALLFFAVFVTSTPIFSGVFKCDSESGIVYSDRPCPDGLATSSENAERTPSTAKASEPAANPKGRVRNRLAISAPEVLIESCLNKWRYLLKDPRSPYVVSSQIDLVKNLERPDREPWKEVILNVRAKNSFGGYIPEVFVCGVAEDGLADIEVTDFYQAMFRLDMEFFLDDRYID